MYAFYDFHASFQCIWRCIFFFLRNYTLLGVVNFFIPSIWFHYGGVYSFRKFSGFCVFWSSHREWNVFYWVICAIYSLKKKLKKMCWLDVLHFIFMWHPALISWRFRSTGCIMWKFRCRFVFVCCRKHWQDVCNVFLPFSSLSFILVSSVRTLNLLFCGSYVVV